LVLSQQQEYYEGWERKMQAKDLRKIHMSPGSIVLDILISHSQAGADLRKIHVSDVTYLLDIDFALW
jgi:hypothetical protein